MPLAAKHLYSSGEERWRVQEGLRTLHCFMMPLQVQSVSVAYPRALWGRSPHQGHDHPQGSLGPGPNEGFHGEHAFTAELTTFRCCDSAEQMLVEELRGEELYHFLLQHPFMAIPATGEID